MKLRVGRKCRSRVTLSRRQGRPASDRRPIAPSPTGRARSGARNGATQSGKEGEEAAREPVVPLLHRRRSAAQRRAAPRVSPWPSAARRHVERVATALRTVSRVQIAPRFAGKGQAGHESSACKWWGNSGTSSKQSVGLGPLPAAHRLWRPYRAP